MEIRDFLRVIRARRGRIILTALMVTALAVGVSLLQTPMYEGQAKILVTERSAGAALFGELLSQFSSQPERGLLTQIELMRLRPVAEAAIKDLGLRTTPTALLSQVEFTATGETNLVTVTVRDEDPERAAAIANALAEAYIHWSRDLMRFGISEAADEIETRLESLEDRISAIAADLGRNPSPVLEAEMGVATSQYMSLAEKLEQLRVNEQLEGGFGSVVSTSTVATRPSAPQPRRNGMLGLILGVSLGIGFAFLSDALDNAVKTTDEAETIFDAPILGRIPLLKGKKNGARSLPAADKPGSSSAEAYRGLRTNLDFINFEHNVKTILVASAEPHEGKSTVAANLASVLSQAGKRVILMSCDFHRPVVEEFYRIGASPGLSDVLAGRAKVNAALQSPEGHSNLWILRAGEMPPNPSELLGSETMRRIVSEMRDTVDWIVVDSPPLLAVADAAVAARWADGVLVVVRSGVSTRDAGRRARETLDRVGARILGVTMWGLEESMESPRRYGYYGGYRSGA